MKKEIEKKLRIFFEFLTAILDPSTNLLFVLNPLHL